MLKYILPLIIIDCVFTLQCPSTVNDEFHLVSLSPQCFRKVYDSDQHDGHKLSRILNQRISNYKRILQDIKMNDVQHLKTQPVIKWAQSQSQIFLNLRLSHRHDSPTCSDIRFQQISSDILQTQGDFNISRIENNEQKNSSRLMFLSQCFFTHQKLMFSLDLEFFAKINRLTIRKQGFGRYTVVGNKQINAIWTQPFTGWQNAGIWSDMRNKYSADMDKYFQMVQDLNDIKASKSKRKFRNKKAQTKFQMGEL